MYHYITIGSFVINMTGVGIIAFLATFLYVVAKDARWRGLRFQTFLRFVPIYILIMYFLGTYFYYLFDRFAVFPLSIKQILLYLTPYNYNFSTIGVVLGALVGGWKFLKGKEKKLAWLSSWLYGIMRGIVPLGIFLLLGDAFIGIQTDAGFFVSAIRSDSLVAIYDKVIPLGFYLSLLGLIGGSYLYLFHKSLPLRHTYLGYSLLSFLLGVLFIFQQYPRRFVFPMGSLSIDSKQIFMWLVAAGFLYLWIRERKFSKPRPQSPIPSPSVLQENHDHSL